MLFLLAGYQESRLVYTGLLFLCLFFVIWN